MEFVRDGDFCVVDGYVAKMGGGYHTMVALPVGSIGFRIGTPISRISTRPGEPGYAEWCRISASWGY